MGVLTAQIAEKRYFGHTCPDLQFLDAYQSVHHHINDYVGQ